MKLTPEPSATSPPPAAKAHRSVGFLLVLAVAITGCSDTGLAGPSASTSAPRTTASSTIPATPPATDAPMATTTTPGQGLPIDDDWVVTEVRWGVEPACCDAPAVGEASPEAPLPDPAVNPDAWGADATWPEDGFYDVSVTRAPDPPGVVQMAIRRWVSCTQLPELCPLDPPAFGIVADPATEVVATVFLDALTVVIHPLQTWQEGVPAELPVTITGTGRAFSELLSGWCGGYLPDRHPVNCGLDHAFIDWVWAPYRAGSSVEEIAKELETRGADPAFPFEVFDDRSTDLPCAADRRCPLAYRGPQGTDLIVDFGLLDLGEDWPAGLYGWWTSLEVRDGRPILYIDAGRLAG